MTDDLNSKEHNKCGEFLEKAVLRNPRIQLLLDSIEELGCPLPKNFLACRPCDGQISGGFLINSENQKNYTPQIIVCENKPMEVETFENTIVHELIHAYDSCRAKIDFSNCTQHACTEIRASALSGECGILHEALRGHVKLQGGLQDCSKRRALLSLQMNPACEGIASKAIDAAFTKCYSDQSPFEK